jgi:outer membrane murein-binding lipoprotein Lpp
MRTRILAAALFLPCLVLAGCRDPRVDANIAEALTQVGAQMTSFQQDVSLMQEQVDSLRQVVARQDTIIARLANASGVPLPQR